MREKLFITFLLLALIGSSLVFPRNPLRMEIPPGDWRVLGEGFPKFPSEVNLAVKRIPKWLRESFYWKMLELSLQELKLNGQVSATLFDVNGDGLKDLAVGTQDGLVKFYINEGSEYHPVFSAQKVYVPARIDVVDNATLFPVDVDGDGDMDLIIGNNRGQVILYENLGLKNGWTDFREKQGYFVVKASKKGKGKKQYEPLDVGKDSVPVFADFNGDGKKELVVGAGDGTLHFFILVSDEGRPYWKEQTSVFNGLKFGKRAAPSLIEFKGKKALLVFNSSGEYSVVVHRRGRWEEVLSRLKPSWIWPPEKGILLPSVVDFNGDGMEDLLLGTSSGTVHFVPSIEMRLGQRKTESGSLSAGSEWLGGYDLIQGGTTPFTTIKLFNPYYSSFYSRLILRTEDRFLDEVAFSISNMATSVLKAMVDAPKDKEGISYSPEVLRENAAWIYRMASRLPYVRLVEKKGFTTLELRFRDGRWHRLSPEIYYWYVVHPRLRFEAPSLYLGKYWRGVLALDRKYGKSALEAVKNAENVYDAVEKLQRWSRSFFEWGEESHDKLPQEPYFANYGSCGEWSIYGVALGRTLLIPTRLANDWGEDHVWNEFYSDGAWHRWDINFETPKAIDYPEVYEKEWKKLVSTIWTMRGDDLLEPITSPYTRAARVKIKVLSGKEPVAGAMVLVLSNWAVERKYDKVPLLSIWGITNEEGEVYFDLGENKYELVVSAPYMGVKKQRLEDPEGKRGHIVEGKSYEVKITFPPSRENKPNLPERTVGSVFSKTLKLSFSSFERARVPLRYPAPYHFITGDEYRVPSRGRAIYMVVSPEEFKNFLRARPFKALAYGPLGKNLRIPQGGIVIFYNLSRATWYRIRVEK